MASRGSWPLSDPKRWERRGTPRPRRVPPPTIQSERSQPSRRCRTLIVEDDRVARSALATILRAMGFEVDEASDVADGTAKLIAWQPQCVVLDLMLPDGTGTALLRYVRDSKLPVKVAVVTAANDPRLLADVKALAPDALFPKPLDVDALLEWLDRHS